MIPLTKEDSLFLLAPHPDDECLAMGGLIQRAVEVGARVRVVFATNGDNNPWPQRFVERRLRVSPRDQQRWGGRRSAEACAALDILGLGATSAHFLNLPDQGMTHLLMSADAAVIDAMARELVACAPTLIVGPSRDDAHRDHSTLHILLRLAVRKSGMNGARCLDYVIHHARFDPRETPVTLHLTPEQRSRKLDAIHRHETQMAMSRKRFSSYADRPENFWEPAACQRNHPFHPVRSAAVEGSVLRLVVPRQTFAFAGRRLLLSMESETGGPLRWFVPLPMGMGAISIKDAQSGKEVGTGTCRRVRGETMLDIPVSQWGDLAEIFVKITSSPLSFYDRSGWREVPALPAAPVVSSAPTRTFEAVASLQSSRLRRTFLINLDTATDRRVHMEQAFAATGMELERVSAIDGRTLVLPHPAYSQSLYHRYHGRTTKPGEIGCYLSHIKAMEAFLATGDSHGLICEDDLVLTPEFERVLDAAMRTAGAWNVLRLSGLSPGQPARVVELAEGFFLCVNFGRLKGAGAYIVDRRAAEAMIAGLLPMWLPWDHAVDREWPFGLRACSVYPFPVSQTENLFRSSIQGGKASKLAAARRWVTTYPYQAANEISRWCLRGWHYMQIKVAFMRVGLGAVLASPWLDFDLADAWDAVTIFG